MRCRGSDSPWRGRSVTLSTGSGGAAPAAGASVQRCSSIAATSVISSIAKCWPMHTRGPIPNGSQAPRGTGGASGRKRSGRKSSGASNQRGSRYSTHGVT